MIALALAACAALAIWAGYRWGWHSALHEVSEMFADDSDPDLKRMGREMQRGLEELDNEETKS